jgi:hypothetical protein
MPLVNSESIEGRLRQVLETQTVEQAVATLHRGDGIGLLPLCAAVEKVAGLSARDAKRLVVKTVGLGR